MSAPNEVDEYIKISVAAVGGPDTAAGQEMMRLLMTRAGLEVAPDEIEVQGVPIPEIQAPGGAAKPGELFTPDLEDMFSRVFNKDSGQQ